MNCFEMDAVITLLYKFMFQLFHDIPVTRRKFEDYICRGVFHLQKTKHDEIDKDSFGLDGS